MDPVTGKPIAPKPVEPDAKAQMEAQREADAALRERMRRAQGKTPEPKPQDAQTGTQPARDQAPKETAAERERRIANEAWLRRVPDDPGGLLRAKFKLEEKRRRRGGDR